MSIYDCALCGKHQDADYVGCYEYGDELICEACDVEREESKNIKEAE